MTIAQEVIDQAKSGLSAEELARKFSWKDLSSVDLEGLLKSAQALRDAQQSYNLLVFLFRVSFGKDLWFSTKVLGQAMQHPIMTLLDRQAILPTMRTHLNQIKDQIAVKPPDEEKMVQYWLMEANYYAVNGQMLGEMGERVEAAQNLKIAQSIFEQLGLFQQAAKYKALTWQMEGEQIIKAPLAKTSPIRFRMPVTQRLAQVKSSHAPATPRPGKESASPDGNAAVRPAPETQAAPTAGGEVEAQQPAGKRGAASPQASLAGFIAPAQSSPANERLPAAEFYYPLPDVWMKDGQLHILGQERFESDEALRIKKQIEQETDILMGIELLSQMYLTRRNLLEREVRQLEKKAITLRQRIDRLQKKGDALESASEST